MGRDARTLPAEGRRSAAADAEVARREVVRPIAVAVQEIHTLPFEAVAGLGCNDLEAVQVVHRTG